MASVLHSATVSSVLLILAVQLLCCSQQTGASHGPPATCPTGYKNCGYNHKYRCLTYVKSDVNNCGDCGVKCGAPPHSSPACSNSKCGFTCTKAFKNCDLKDQNGCETCIQADINNCGDCKKKCPLYANTLGPKCWNSTCTGVCQTGWKDCNKNLALDGCEAQLETDNKNCGACGAQCANAANAEGVCSGSKCRIQCYKGFGNCDRRGSNGCEVALDTDILNCGTCGHKCACPPNANPTCTAGSCGYTCKDGYTDCNGLAQDGCESRIASDILNCGACGAACTDWIMPNVQPLCSSGTCGIKICNKGFNNCNGLLADGCEVTDATLQVDALNCGACGNKCQGSPPNAIPSCAGGECKFTCKDGFKDCNGEAADGCEVVITTFPTDVMNCGACGNKCQGSPPNAIPSCAGGECKFTCKDGFKDCNGEAVDGCEVDITTFPTDVMNCGACGIKCPGDPNTTISYCEDGVCGFYCNKRGTIRGYEMGFRDCNQDAADGCEVDIETDLLNCGGCGWQCGCPGDAVPTCALPAVPGASGCSCNKDCNGEAADGYEVNITTDVMNCGDCNYKCRGPPSAVAFCIDGECGFACKDGSTDCFK